MLKADVSESGNWEYRGLLVQSNVNVACRHVRGLVEQSRVTADMEMAGQLKQYICGKERLIYSPVWWMCSGGKTTITLGCVMNEKSINTRLLKSRLILSPRRIICFKAICRGQRAGRYVRTLHQPASRLLHIATCRAMHAIRDTTIP